MNCEKFQSVVSDLAYEILMDASEQAAALQHKSECEACAASLDEHRDLTLGLRSLAGNMKGLSAPAQLEEKMLAAFRERRSDKNVVVPIVVERRRSWYWAAAIAAALLMAFAIFVVRGNLLNGRDKTLVKTPSQPDKSLAGQPPESPRKEEQAVEVVGPERIVRQPAPRSTSKYVARKPKAVDNTRYDSNNSMASTAGNQSSTPVEVTTDFYPIGYSNTPNLQEGGQLLRVELPRAAIARFGLPVNMDRAGQRVKADVLVGSDGLAQAIRFVQ
ncbi:MAG TPA: hypothetical protein VN643_02470 [Pyrinomonadaceae bacterium]|nr:hypothetical protein [Pyrinomonadaceae bacterium]